jgi:hypothetical protein
VGSGSGSGSGRGIGSNFGGLVKSRVFNESTVELVRAFLVEIEINCSGVERTLGVSADGSGDIGFLCRPSLRPVVGLWMVRGLDGRGDDDSLGEEPLEDPLAEAALGEDERCDILKEAVE